MFDLKHLASLLQAQFCEQASIINLSHLDKYQNKFQDWHARRQRWLDSGRQASMHYLAKNMPKAFDPSLVMPETKSMLVALFPWPTIQPRKCQSKACGQVPAYAYGTDYHQRLKKAMQSILKAWEPALSSQSYRILIDANPLAEKFWAMIAGLGWIGRNTLLINPQYGSACFIVTVLFTNSLPNRLIFPDSTKARACPSDCRCCLEACPTAALDPNEGLDARLCLAWWGIEQHEVVPRAMAQSMGTRLFGCDSCVQACPFNAAVLTQRYEVAIESFLTIRNQIDMNERFDGTVLRRQKWQGIVRNGIIAAGNSNDPSLRPIIQELSNSGEKIVADQAKIALATQILLEKHGNKD